MKTHKAKRLDRIKDNLQENKEELIKGEWVDDSKGRENHIDGSLYCIDNKFDVWVEVDLSTECERVRGTDFFEGDEVESVNDPDVTGFIEYDDLYYWWKVVITTETGSKLTSQLGVGNWKPTGRNRYD